MAGLRILIAMLAGLVGFVGAATAAEVFKDCPNCPSMVKVPPGTFMMGSSSAETTHAGLDERDVAYERPQHTVTIMKEFALGQYAVTRGEFAAFVQETGHDPSGCFVYMRNKWILYEKRSWRTPGFIQTDQHPVVCVSFDDAQRYVRWLSGKTGKTYRLPTEAEWEYAARAGTTTTRFWGDGTEQACEFANVADVTGAAVMRWNKDSKEQAFQCRDGYAYTAPVGSFRPNAFDLYDMLGNAFAWIEDCYHDSYREAPADGSAWTSGDCKNRVQRGGSWSSSPKGVRSADRNGGAPVYRNIDIGFRVARTLAP